MFATNVPNFWNKVTSPQVNSKTSQTPSVTGSAISFDHSKISLSAKIEDKMTKILSNKIVSEFSKLSKVLKVFYKNQQNILQFYIVMNANDFDGELLLALTEAEIKIEKSFPNIDMDFENQFDPKNLTQINANLIYSK